MAATRNFSPILKTALAISTLFLIASTPGTGRKATSLPTTNGDSSQGYLVTLEASWEPIEVEVERGGRVHRLPPRADHGPNTFYVPPGVTRATAFITGGCKGACGPCFDDTVFVRAVETRYVDAWQLTSESTLQTGIVRGWDRYGPTRFSVRVQSTEQPLIQVRIQSWCTEEPDYDNDRQWSDCGEHRGLTEETRVAIAAGPTSHGDGSWSFTVTMSNTEARFHRAEQAGEEPDSAQVHFEVTATASGYCEDGEGPCQPGPDDEVVVLDGN